MLVRGGARQGFQDSLCLVYPVGMGFGEIVRPVTQGAKAKSWGDRLQFSIYLPHPVGFTRRMMKVSS